MKTVRHNVFETNSSSTHSIVILTDEEYNRLNTGLLYLNDSDEVITAEQRQLDIIEAMTKEGHVSFEQEDIENYLDTLDYNDFGKSLDDWLDNSYLETDVNNYTSKSGDNIVILSKYGNDY